MKLSDFFEKVFVVNLDRRTDRLANIESQKDIIGKYTRFSAYDCNTLTTRPGKPPHNGFTTISMGNYGNVLSQRKIIEELDMGMNIAENVLILEDDVKFIRPFDEFLNSVPKNWDMIYFGGNHVEPLIPIDRTVGKCQMTLTAHAVAMRYTIASEIMYQSRNKNIPIDLYYAMLHKKYNVYCPLQCIATQISGYSDIESKEVDYSMVIK